MGELAASELSIAFQATSDQLLAEVRHACPGSLDWSQRIAAGIRAALDFAARNPSAAQLLTTDILRDVEAGPRCYDQLIQTAAALIRDVTREGQAESIIREETLVGGLIGLVRMQVLANRTAGLSAIAPDAIYFVLVPYLGCEQALAVAGVPSGGESR